MKPVRLFTAFHGNLDFSALPEADRATVIARCYWPLLSLPEEHGIRIGFEMAARTLEILATEDPEWVKRFRTLAEGGLLEPIASGRAQIVAPLAPVEVNRLNLKLGAELYERILGFVPETYFVSEQTWSEGLASIYREAGARRIVMEWNNPAARRQELRGLRAQPCRLRTSEGPGPELLWNDSILFQKMQRVAHGEIPEGELFDFLERLAAEPEAEALCVYGGDVEIFDYRPSRSLPGAGDSGATEMARLVGVLKRLAADARFEFALPREIVDQGEVLPEVALASAEDPIPCKKQPRYNPTRWAVSGRDAIGMNTRCHALLRNEGAVRRLAGEGAGGVETSALVDLWRSDFRTRATEEKMLEFEAGMSLASEQSRARLEALVPPLREGEDVLLSNPGSEDWAGMPVEIPLRLPAGRVFDLGIRARRGGEVSERGFQVEVLGRHRDGSLREVTLVLEPRIPAGSDLALELVPVAASAPGDAPEPDPAEVATNSVEASFSLFRGAALERLAFPEIERAPLVGRIAHGRFDEIAYTPDFYTGHVVAISETNEKRSDLGRTELALRQSASGPVRLTFEGRVETPFGAWRKIYRLYHNAPRLDLVHDLAFHEARIASLRLGMVTLLPEAWDRSTLRYGTVNGGAEPEWHALPPGASINQSRAVSASVSATSCLGATEGWVALADRDKGLLVSSNRAESSVAPMLDFEEVDGSFFCRLSHSAAETDETRATFLRGRRRFAFSLEGFRTTNEGVTERARLRQQGLIYRTEKSVGITSGL